MNKTSSTDFRLSMGLRYAWLLRSDVRQQRDIDDVEAQKDFVLWWIIYGRYEYPGAEPLNDHCKAVLFEPQPDKTLRIGYFGINRLINYLLTIRKDLAENADIETLEGVIDLNCWLYLYGLREHKLLDIVDDQTISELNRPIVDFFGLENGNNQALAAISPLMYFVWRMRQDVRQTFDLNNADQREKYLAWFFFQAVVELDLASLVDTYWRKWLQKEIVLQETVKIPRAGKLIWTFRQDIRDAFDLTTQQGCLGLANWVTENLRHEAAIQWLFQQNATANTEQTPGVNLIGFAFGELGIGEDVRMAAAACDKAGIDYKVVNISPGESVRQKDMALSGAVVDALKELEYPVNVFCLTGFDTARVYLEKGKELFKGRYNIGWWPWELPVWPEQWSCAFDLVDEVWAATDYTQRMYRNATSKPVTLMPLPVSVGRAKLIPRRQLDLPEQPYLFLYIFDFNSYLARKNPEAAVKAFLRAFPEGSENVGLVLKTMNSLPNNPKWKAFQRLCNKDKRIILIETTMDREIVLGLVHACDAYVSLHRAEGFGRTLAEAMLFGKPVIATDFSGNKDFVRTPLGFPVEWRKKKVKQGEYPFVTEYSNVYWADPDIDDAARQMKTVFETGKNESKSRQIGEFARRQFSLHRIGDLIKNRLLEIA